ncbi:MAG: chromate resistance protein ChrB domain-containing protein [Chloroflexota bacterium]
MRWVTRKNANVDRVACPWLIKRFVDPEAELTFVPSGTDPATISDSIPFDMPGVELGHVAGRCSFESIVVKYNLADPALLLLAKIVHGADVPADLPQSPAESHGLRAMAYGFAQLHADDDYLKIKLGTPMYDALYAWCQEQARTITQEGTGDR